MVCRYAWVWSFCLIIGCSQANQKSGQVESREPDVALQRFEFTRPLMGVEFKIILYAPSEAAASRGAALAFAEIQCFDDALSDYKSQSEIKLLCELAPHDQPMDVSSRLYIALRHAKAMHLRTSGAFDITVGPASRVWRTARKRNRLPSDEKVKDALGRMGMEHIRLLAPSTDETDGAGAETYLQIDLADMQLDFGGIAKGLAADRALQVLRNAEIRSALIDASGDVVVSDAPPEQDAWTVEFVTGRETNSIQLVNQAVATSGDVFQFMEVDGVRYSHLVDPKTGQAIATPRIVTVIGDSGMECDAFASAVSVVGRKGLEQLETKGLSIQIIEASNPELTEFDRFRTPEFPETSLVKPSQSSE